FIVIPPAIFFYYSTLFDSRFKTLQQNHSTNLIESFNKQIKRYSRRKEQFQNEESLERFLVSIFDTYNQKFLNRSHKGFQQVTDTLVSMFTE
ncbi:transposase, partial [Enterococcus faecalis]